MRKRPTFEEDNYSRNFRLSNGRMSPSCERKYFRFRSALKLYLISIRGNNCELCKAEYKTQKIAYDNLFVHHKIHVKDGGLDDDDNLILVCLACHQSQHSFDISWKFQRIEFSELPDEIRKEVQFLKSLGSN